VGIKIFLSVIAIVVAFIPTELFFLAIWAFEPQGFWQNLALTGIGIWFLESIQVLFLILLIFFFIEIMES